MTSLFSLAARAVFDNNPSAAPGSLQLTRPSTGEYINMLNVSDPTMLFEDPIMRRRQECFPIAQLASTYYDVWHTPPNALKLDANVMAYVLQQLEAAGLVAVFDEAFDTYRTMG